MFLVLIGKFDFITNWPELGPIEPILQSKWGEHDF